MMLFLINFVNLKIFHKLSKSCLYIDNQIKCNSYPLIYQNNVIFDKFCKIKNYFLGDSNSQTSRQVEFINC